MIKILNFVGSDEDFRLVSEVYRVSQACEICAQLPFVQARHASESVLATEFNDAVTVTLMDFKGQKILHLIDLTCRFIATCVLDSIAPNEVVEKMFEIWINVFGHPKKFISCSVALFNNFKFREKCKASNIVFTFDKIPGLSKSQNRIFNATMQKICATRKFKENYSVFLSTHSINSQLFMHGFSPYHLLMGYVPKLPKFSYVEGSSNDQFNLEHLKGIANARRALLQAETNLKLERSLAPSFKPSSNNKFFSGDNVYFKRTDCKKWKGLGKVIGQSLQQILIKCKGYYYKVHACRVMLENVERNGKRFKINSKSKVS